MEKTLLLGKIEARRRGTTQGEIGGWHHGLSRHEFKQAAKDGEGQEAWCAVVHGIAKRQT